MVFAMDLEKTRALALDYVENKIDAAMKDFNFLLEPTAEELRNLKLFIGRHIGFAYCHGYEDGWKRETPKPVKKLYV